MSQQANLHVHSEHSFLDGFSKVTDIAKRAKELGQQAVALTDHGECGGHLKFQKACLDEGIKPIFGMEGYWHHDLSEVMGTKDRTNSHICLLAKDQKGLSNLWAWSTIAYDSKHHHYKPLADPALMREYAEGIYGSDGCLMTGLGRAVQVGDDDAARQYMSGLLDIFRERFYIELHTWQFMEPTPDEQHPEGPRCRGKAEVGKVKCQHCLNTWMTDLNHVKLGLANELGVPFVIVNDCHHSKPEDWNLKDMANKINKDKSDQIADGQKADHHMGEDELVEWMGRHGIGREIVEQGISNSWEIAQSCNAEIKPMLGMPTFTKSVQEDTSAFLDAVEEGFNRKVVDGGLDVSQYWERVQTEAELICERQFAGYFLIVADYVKAAKNGVWSQYVTPGADKDPMITGPGRGSAGGALVSWLTDITALDPLKYDLLFERFMAPGRKGYPDIDVDFPQSRLRGMANYLGARHGADHVCALATVGRNGPKGMLRDLCAAFDVPWPDRKAMAAIIESAAAIVATEREAADEQTGQEDIDDDLSWDEVLAEKGGELIPYARKYAEMFDLLGKMIGRARNAGKHASGWLINDQPLLGLIPLRTRNHRKADEVVTTQWDMWDIEEMGGVKFDLLGLRHLDTLDGATKQVARRHGVQLDFESFGDAEMGDTTIWEPVDRGHTTGLFQIETPNATQTAVKLKPRNENDIAALLSIIRPGVKDAGETERFLKRRAGLEPVVYDHPLMEAIVADTYGVLVYQEQMMRAARDLAGYAPDEVDDLRKAIGKKLPEKIAEHEAKFREGCLANPAFVDPVGDTKVATRVVAKIWASINASGNYAFNKSHAMGYGLVTVWEAWLAQHYPSDYVVELMATDSANINRYVRDARRRGIPILPPDINASDQKFTIGDDGSIRYGLDTLHGVGAAAANDIRKNRPYTSFQDFLDRSTKVNKGQIASLVKIGAFDSLEFTPAWDGNWRPACRSRLLQQLYDHEVWMKHTAEGKRSKLDTADLRGAHIDAWFAKHRNDVDFAKRFPTFNFEDSQVIYEIEQELVGNYVTVDPMAPYLEALDAVAIRDPAEIADRPMQDVFVIGGQISTVKVITVKNGRSKGQEMAFIGIDYNEQTFEMTVFSETWAACKLLLKEGAPVACTVIRDARGCHLASLERLDLLWAATG